MYSDPADVIEVSGLKPKHVGLADGDAAGLDALVTKWLEWIASHINTRLDLSGDLPATDREYKGVEGVATLTAVKMAAVAKEARTTNVVRVDDFAVETFDASKVWSKLDADLAPFAKRIHARNRKGRVRMHMFLAGHPEGE